MKYILISVSVAIFIIGLHQAMTVGIVASYPFMMMAVALVIGTRLYILNKKPKRG